jgi:hypothetical protein
MGAETPCGDGGNPVKTKKTTLITGDTVAMANLAKTVEAQQRSSHRKQRSASGRKC